MADIKSGNAGGFMQRLQSFFAGAKFDQIVKDTENWFQNVVFIVSSLCGLYIEAEHQTSDDKGYALPWQADGRTVIKVGANFSSSLRRLEKWITVYDSQSKISK